MEQGYIQVYTGNGKGKTTAAFGLALRAVCAGKKVYVGQFLKGMEYCESTCDQYLPNIEIHQFGNSHSVDKETMKDDIGLVKEGFDACAAALKSGAYDLVILDEINNVVHLNLISVEDLINMLENRAKNVEVVLTGRHAPEEIVEMADLVTEMRAVKHYYTQGVLSREGFDR